MNGGARGCDIVAERRRVILELLPEALRVDRRHTDVLLDDLWVGGGRATAASGTSGLDDEQETGRQVVMS